MCQQDNHASLQSLCMYLGCCKKLTLSENHATRPSSRAGGELRELNPRPLAYQVHLEDVDHPDDVLI